MQVKVSQLQLSNSTLINNPTSLLQNPNPRFHFFPPCPSLQRRHTPQIRLSFSYTGGPHLPTNHQRWVPWPIMVMAWAVIRGVLFLGICLFYCALQLFLRGFCSLYARPLPARAPGSWPVCPIHWWFTAAHVWRSACTTTPPRGSAKQPRGARRTKVIAFTDWLMVTATVEDPVLLWSFSFLHL